MIPQNINLPRLWAASFGFTFTGELRPETVEAVIMELGRVLGFEDVAIKTFWDGFKHQLQERASEFTSDPRNFMLLDKWYNDLQVLLETQIIEIGPDRMKEFGRRVEAWLQPRQILTPEEFGRLNSYVGANWMIRKAPPYIAAPVLKAEVTALELLNAFPSETRQAMRAWRPSAAKQGSQQVLFLQNQGKIAFLGHQAAAAKGDTHPSSTRIEITDLLRMWTGVFETSMFEACLLLWYCMGLVKGKPDWQDVPGMRPTDNKPNPKKGDVYNQLLTWCAQNKITFPFWDRLVSARNKEAHWQLEFVDGKQVVRLNDIHGNLIDEIDFDTVREQSAIDYATASHFQTGVLLAMLAADNLDGVFDSAWAKVISQVADPTILLDPEEDE